MNKYPVLPHIAYGLIKEDGFFITVPFKGVSLNAYKRMHFGEVKKLRGRYKSVIDLVVVSIVNKMSIKSFNEEGIRLWDKSMFKSKVDIEWVLTFMINELRDPSNYTQKIFLDAVTDVGILQGDDERYVNSDKTFFGGKGYDSITCILRGSIINTMFLKDVNVIKYDDLIASLELI